MHGYLFLVHYNTKLTKNKLTVYIHASSGVEACVKAMELLENDDIEVTGVEKII